MNEPTQEQIKEFWEWCGFKLIIAVDKETLWSMRLWIDPLTNNGGSYPSLDLNNLFKYAVPKLNGRYKLEGTGGYHFANVWKDPIAYVEVRDTDPALALFWAIWEAIEGEVIKWDGAQSRV